MENNEKQLHVRLSVEIYQRLKVKCASELISMQDYASKLIAANLVQNVFKEKSRENGEDQKACAQKQFQHFPISYNVDRADLINMTDANEKQLHVRLPVEIYQRLKVKCASELISMQDYVSKLIASNLAQNVFKGKSKERGEGQKAYALKQFQHFPIFYDVDQADLIKLADAAVMLHFKKGEVLVREGEMPTSFYIIGEGKVKISKSTSDGKEFTIAVRYRGETFAPNVTIKGIPHFASTVALEDTDVLAIGREDFLAFMARSPVIWARIIDLEIERIGHLFDQLIDMVESVARRLSKVLYALSYKNGNTLCFTHKEIAEMTGTTIETATRVLTRLKNAGIITSARGKITIRDFEKLRIYSENTQISTKI